jgi:hypothetical protein
MLKAKSGFIIVILVIILSSCQKVEETTFILLSPDNLFISTQPLKVVSISVTCSSPNTLQKLKVISHKDDSFSKQELDTIISGKKFSMNFEYQVPEQTDSVSIILEFILVDSKGDSYNNMRVLQVGVPSKYLTESAGHELFSKKSGKQNAYDLIKGTPIFSALSDTSMLHIVDTSNSTTLMRKWISKSGVRFVKFNGFDYANCTNFTIRDGFAAGLKYPFVDNLSTGDILIAQIPVDKTRNTLVAVKIVDIIDSQGSDWDRYIFNIKR